MPLHAKNLVLAATALGFLQGCGSDRSSRAAPAPTPVAGAGRRGENDLAELQTQTPTSVPSLVAAFGVEDRSVGGLIAFYTGQRYFSGAVEKIGAIQYRIEATIGTYAEDGGVITTTRRRTTCLSQLQADREPRRVTGSTTGSSLLVTKGAVSIVATRLTPPAGPPPQGLVIDWGCFDVQTGAFTPGAWQDVD